MWSLCGLEAVEASWNQAGPLLVAGLECSHNTAPPASRRRDGLVPEIFGPLLLIAGLLLLGLACVDAFFIFRAFRQ